MRGIGEELLVIPLLAGLPEPHLKNFQNSPDVTIQMLERNGHFEP